MRAMRVPVIVVNFVPGGNAVFEVALIGRGGGAKGRKGFRCALETGWFN